MNESLFNHQSETLKHVNEVRGNIVEVIKELDHRAQVHDGSKFVEPEASILADNNHRLAVTKYGTPEYAACLEAIKPALDHHYAKNRHHPQHWPNGVDDMTLVDLIEMLCDWRAATKRNKDGNIRTSIDHNAERFKLSPQLQQIMHNTVRELFKD